MLRKLMIATPTLGAEPAIPRDSLEQRGFSRSIFTNEEGNVRRYLDIDSMRERSDIERIATCINTLLQRRNPPQKRPQDFGNYPLPPTSHRLSVRVISFDRKDATLSRQPASLCET